MTTLIKSQFRLAQLDRIYQYVRLLVLLAALTYPLTFGHYWYYSASPPPRFGYFVEGVFMSSPLSLGLVLSTLRFGRRHKMITLGLLLPSAIIHFIFQVPDYPIVTLYILIAECLGAYLLFAEGTAR